MYKFVRIILKYLFFSDVTLFLSEVHYSQFGALY